MKKLFSNIICHRGYHGDGIVENTLEAFSKSIQASLPIELDVFLTKDHQLVVFHDDNLKRLMGIDRRIEDCCYQELLSYSFLEGKGKIPLLSEVLTLVDRKVLLLIEVKRCRNYSRTCQLLEQMLSTYSGSVQIQSFDFRIVRWFLKKKKYSTGLLVSPNSRNQYYWYYLLVNSFFFVHFIIRPSFVSYDWKGLPSSFITQLKKKGMLIYLWTIRTEKELDFAKKYGDFYIAEDLGSFR